ncbi:MAG: hypothetical protein ACPGJS_04935 [Flammeovirgaceae bacterium]
MPILHPVITNHYDYELPVYAYDGNQYTAMGASQPLTLIPCGKTVPAQKLDAPAEHLLIKVPGIGDLTFINLEKNHLTPYDEAKLEGEYGILIRYQRREIYLRYNLLFPYWEDFFTIDKFGTLTINLNDKRNACYIKVPEFTMSS